MPESVHLCDYVIVDKNQINTDLEDGMEKIRQLVEAGRALRSKIGIKVKIPLNSATLICDKKTELKIKDLLELLNEEINVKDISFERNANNFMVKSYKINHSKIGPKFKQRAKLIVDEINKIDEDKLSDQLIKDKQISVKIDEENILLKIDDFEIVEKEKENIARSDIENITLLLDTKLTPELEAEGFSREIVRRIQSMRKELDLHVEDFIITEIKIDVEKQKMLKKWLDYIKSETRSNKIIFTEQPKGDLLKDWKIDEIYALISIKK